PHGHAPSAPPRIISTKNWWPPKTSRFQAATRKEFGSVLILLVQRLYYCLQPGSCTASRVVVLLLLALRLVLVITTVPGRSPLIGSRVRGTNLLLLGKEFAYRPGHQQADQNEDRQCSS